jgi:ribonuclease D
MKLEFIESPAALAAVCDKLKNQSCIAVDTEFARERSYFPHIGLIQIAADDTVACIDPLAFDTKPLLSELLLNPAIIKVFHACMQDLEVLELALGAKPCPLFDTQLGHALTHQDSQCSYASLVTRVLNIQLHKSETRTNWLKRPLSKAQLEYAADDVRYLLDLYQNQLDDLQAQGRSAWIQEECDHVCRKDLNPESKLAQSWQRVKAKERLSGIELAVLQAAASWREHQAIALDKPRRKVLPDDILIKIAIQRPDNTSQLKRIHPIIKYIDMCALDSLVEDLSNAYTKPQSEWPSLKRRQLTQTQSNALSQVLNQLREKASELGISSSVLCNRKDAEKLVQGKRDLRVLQGWRLACIGEELLQTVTNPEGG